MERRCPVCDWLNEPMGQLGSRVHYRCRACGMDYSHPIREVENVEHENSQEVQ